MSATANLITEALPSRQSSIKDAANPSHMASITDHASPVQVKDVSLDNLRAAISSAFSKIPVSSFPLPPAGEVFEVSSDMSTVDALKFFDENCISAAPVHDVNAPDDSDWGRRYLGMVDVGAIAFWAVQQSQIQANLTVFGGATAAAGAGIGIGALFGAFGAASLGLTSPAAAATGAIAAAVLGTTVLAKKASQERDNFHLQGGPELFHQLLTKEPLCSTKVRDITHSFRWTPFLPLQENDSMLTVLLLLSKHKLRRVPVVSLLRPRVLNLITQSAVIRGLHKCLGFDWFDSIAKRSLNDLGLPLVRGNQVVSVDESESVVAAFALMAAKEVGGLPVTEGSEKKVIGSIDARDLQRLLLHDDKNPKVIRHDGKDVTGSSVRSFFNNYGGHFRPVLTCLRSHSLFHLIQELVRNKVHRAYVVKEDGVLDGVISLRDIISSFVVEPEGYLDNFMGGSLSSL